METVLYFQSQTKANAAEKLSGVQDVAAKCGWFVQIVPKCPSAKLLRALEDFCGFENPNSLRKFFRAQTGKMMTEWRKGVYVRFVDGFMYPSVRPGLGIELNEEAAARKAAPPPPLKYAR